MATITKSKEIKNKKFTEVFVIASFISWFIAEVLYGLVNYIPNSIVYPSSADIFYLIGYVFFILYLYKLNKIYKLEIKIIISSIITFSLFIFYFLFISFNIFHIFNQDDDTLSIVLSFLYPILDAYIAIIGIFYYFQVKTISLAKEHISWIFVSIFGILFFIGDFIYGYRIIIHIDETLLNFFNIYFNVGYTLMGISFLIKYKYVFYFPAR